MRDILAYHRAARPLTARYMEPMELFGIPTKRSIIPSYKYEDYLRELKPIWEKYIGLWGRM